MIWKDFFQKYRVVDIQDPIDLLFQVGKTVGGKPISLGQFNVLIESIKLHLELNAQDGLIDLCCGNGVITYELSKIAKKTMGIDFSQPYIENAIQYKQLPNINYIVHDVLDLEAIKNVEELTEYNKVVLYDSLAYLTPPDLAKILTYFTAVKSIEKILIGNVLDRNRRWNFFNTFNRKLMYFYQYKLLGRDPGLGRWWTKNEIMIVAKKHGFVCTYFEQDPILHTAHYRFDVLMTRDT